MSFKELEQKHNLLNMVILACGKHPTDADIHPLLEERLERFYEDALKCRPWVGLTNEEISEAYNANYDNYYNDVDIVDCITIVRAVEAILREKNHE